MQQTDRDEFERQLNSIEYAYRSDVRKSVTSGGDPAKRIGVLRELVNRYINDIQGSTETNESFKVIASARLRRDLAMEIAIAEPDDTAAETLLFENIVRLRRVDGGHEEVRATYATVASVYSLRSTFTHDQSVRNRAVRYDRKSLDYGRTVHPYEISMTLLSMARNLPPVAAIGVWEVISALEPAIASHRINRAKQLAAAGQLDILRHEADNLDEADLDVFATAVAACKVLGRHKRAKTLALAGLDQAEAQSLTFWADMFRSFLNRKS